MVKYHQIIHKADVYMFNDSRSVTVFVFVPHRHGTGVTGRYTQSHDEYTSEKGNKKGEFWFQPEVAVMSLKAASDRHFRRRRRISTSKQTNEEESTRVNEWWEMQRVELEDPPASYKSVVWENFGFPVQYSNDGKRVVDRCYGLTSDPVNWRLLAKYVHG